MHTGGDMPVVATSTPMTDVIYQMSSKKLGMTTVQENGRLRGVISDGDLRRLLEREGGAALTRTAGEAMNTNPRTIHAEELAAKALSILEERKITSLIVVDADNKVEGVVHLHDLWGVEADLNSEGEGLARNKAPWLSCLQRSWGTIKTIISRSRSRITEVSGLDSL